MLLQRVEKKVQEKALLAIRAAVLEQSTLPKLPRLGFKRGGVMIPEKKCNPSRVTDR